MSSEMDQDCVQEPKLPDLTIDERRRQIHRLLLGMDIFDDHNDLEVEDQLGIAHITDRWSQVLGETLPECPWTAVWRDDGDCQKRIVDVTTVNFTDMMAEVQILSPTTSDGLTSAPLEDLLVCALLNEFPEKQVQKVNVILDHLRFFRQNIYFPWDDGFGGDCPSDMEDLDANSMVMRYLRQMMDSTPQYDWMEVHFSNRFKVYQDFITGQSLDYLKLKRSSANRLP